MWGTFKIFNLTYLHVLHAGMVYINIYERTNVPLSSEHTWTLFHQPLYLQRHSLSRVIQNAQKVKQITRKIDKNDQILTTI